MNIRDFFSPDKVDWMANKISNREVFEYKVEHREGKENVSVCMASAFLDDEELIRDIWHGHDYLVRVSMDRKGKLYSYTGFAFAVDNFGMFDNWDVFKDWFDKRMKQYSDYEVEEYGQVCFF